MQIVEQSARRSLGQVGDLGDLSHASVVFSRDGRYALWFGRDGGLSQVDLSASGWSSGDGAGNSIGGRFPAMAGLSPRKIINPAGSKLFDADTLELLVEVSTGGSKVVGLADPPRQSLCLQPV